MPLSEQAALRKDKHTTVELQHRHFAFIAATIASISDDYIRGEIEQHFADACKRTNPRFDRARFLRACQGL